MEAKEAVREGLGVVSPAPWVVAPRYPADGWWRIVCPPPEDRDWSADHVANVFREGDAPLIAAAPDMLDALYEAEAALQFAIAAIVFAKAPGYNWDESSPRKGLAAVQDAIRKARGTTAPQPLKAK